MSGGTFTVQSYRDAAQEQLRRAELLHNSARSYVATHYYCGIAVECILRAHGLLVTEDFTGRHDLSQLATRAMFFDNFRPEKRPDYAAIINEVNIRWKSNHRYCTTAQLVSYWNDLKLDRMVKGDRTKYNSSRMLQLTEIIVGAGVNKWKNK